MPLGSPAQTSTVAFGNFANAATSFGSLPSAGNTIIATGAIEQFSGTPTPTVSDNQGNTYTVITISDATSARGAHFLAYSIGIGTPSGTFTVTVAGSTDYSSIIAQEWAGITAYDSTAGAAHDNDADGSVPDAQSMTTGATVVADSLSVSLISHLTGEVATAQTIATGFTEIGEYVATVRAQFMSGYRVETATGTKTASWPDVGLSTGAYTKGTLAVFSGEAASSSVPPSVFLNANQIIG